jgi:large subunit ribosomal protein L22
MAVAFESGNQVRAQARWVRMPARKARVVTDHIRGRSVPEARTVLAFTPRAAAREIEKVLQSAVANAEANHGFAGDDLVVSAAYVDEGPTIKRWRARARGRVARIRKRTCHITVMVAPTAVPVGRPRQQRAETTPAAEGSPKPRRARTPRKPAAKSEAAATTAKPKRATTKKKESAS